MENFIYQNTTKIIFGKDAEKNVGSEVKKYSSKILLHYGSGSIKKYGVYDGIIKSLKEFGIEIFELGGVQQNPRLGLVKEGIKVCRENSIDFILAVGGGSVIDSAKAISMGAFYNGDVWDFFDKKAVADSAIPLGVVLTIPASGSESNDISVLNNEDKILKRSYHCPYLLPKFAILNPELTFTLSFYQTACVSADIMAHTMEKYFTQTKKADLTDRLCEANLITILENTPIVMSNPIDYDARAEIMWAGSIANSGILKTGRISDGASHKLAHELGSEYDVVHGASLAIIFPTWMKYVYKANIEKFVQFAVRVFNIDPFFGSSEQIALEGIKRLESFFKQNGLPASLSELGINDEKFDDMASKATEFGSIGNFLKLNKEDSINIYKMAL